MGFLLPWTTAWPPYGVQKKMLMTFFFGKKEIVREWAACVHSQWALFLVMLEAATDEEHGPAAMRVVALRESTVVADGGPAFWARVGKSTGLIVIWWPSGRLGQDWLAFGLSSLSEGQLWVGFWPGDLWAPRAGSGLRRRQLFQGSGDPECRGVRLNSQGGARQLTSTNLVANPGHLQPFSFFWHVEKKLGPCRTHFWGPWSFSTTCFFGNKSHD